MKTIKRLLGLDNHYFYFEAFVIIAERPQPNYITLVDTQTVVRKVKAKEKNDALLKFEQYLATLPKLRIHSIVERSKEWASSFLYVQRTKTIK